MTRARKFSAEEIDMCRRGIKPESMTQRQFVNTRCTHKAEWKKTGLEISDIGFKNFADFFKKTYGDVAYRCAIHRIRPVGYNENSWASALRKLVKCGVVVEDYYNGIYRDDWSPDEDLLVVDGDEEEFPVQRTTRECYRRYVFLRENYVDCGWAAVIGSQKIYFEPEVEEKQ